MNRNTIDLLASRRTVRTPWGNADFATEYAEGITFYSTPSHGGFKVSSDRLAEMPTPYRDYKPFCGQAGWYEEDCDWCVVALCWPHLFEPEWVTTAQATWAHYCQPKLAA